MTERSRILRIYLPTVAGTLIWIAAIVAAPWLKSRGIDGARWLYACFAPICHQSPSRSFFLAGFPLAVCARCFGVYAGFAAGLLLYPFRRGFSSVRVPKWQTFFLVSAPIVFDTGGNLLRLWDTGDGLRFLTGLLWGAILPFYFIAGIGGLRRSFRRDRSSRGESRRVE